MALNFTAPAHARFDGSLRAVGALASAFGRPVWIVDLEATTGDVRDPQFGVVELGFVRVYPGGAASEGSHLIDAGFPMNPYAAKLTGIKSSAYRGAPSFAHFWPQIEREMRGCVISGFGVHALDCRALFHEAARALGSSFEPFRIDTLDARELWTTSSGSDRGQLSEVAAAFGFESPGMHRALADARAAAAALEGLLRVMGSERAMSLARIGWHPWETAERARAQLEELAAALGVALAAARDVGDFAQGVEALAAHGAFPLGRRRGLAWFVGEEEASLEGAPTSLAELAAHFGCELPGELRPAAAIERCSALLAACSGERSDEEVSRLALCKRGAADAARAQLIEEGALPPWTGVSASWRELAAGADRSELEGSSAFDLLRGRAIERGLDPAPGFHAAAASVARELGQPRRWGLRSAKP